MGNLNKAFEIDDGLINDGAVIPESLIGSIRSLNPVYSNGRVTQVVYYKSLTQTQANRIARSVVAYDANDQITTVTTEYYEEDGSTVFQTSTTSVSYSGFDVTGIEDTVS